MPIANSFQDTFTLLNGVKIPAYGFGTYKFGVSHETTVECICLAAQLGYRLFDTASLYMNEQGLGEGLRRSGVPREELFVSSKVWNQDQGYDGTMAAFQESLDDSQLGYFDLYLIHWPIAKDHDHDWQQQVRETWRAMTDLYKAGKIRAIGVSNFLEHHLAVLDDAEVPVMVNELECNLGYPQQQIHDFCHERGIVTISYSPMLGVGTPRPLVEELAQKYGKTPAQIALRWNVQLGSIPIPRSYDEAHMRQNMDVFDFSLTQEEMAALSALEDLNKHQHPDVDRIGIDRHWKTKI